MITIWQKTEAVDTETGQTAVLEMKKSIVLLLFSFGFFLGWGVHWFIVWSDKIIK